MSKLKERILELGDQGLKAKEIAEKLNEEGFVKRTGGKYNQSDIYSTLYHKTPRQMKTPKMIELTPLPRRRGKLLFIYGTFEDIEPIFERITNQ